jgi:hypothetical protein
MYIGCSRNNCYLDFVTDAYLKKNVGYDISLSLSTEGVIRALKKMTKIKKI